MAATSDLDNVLLPGMAALTIAKGLERVNTLGHEMRESEALCALVYNRLVSLRAALLSVRASIGVDDYAEVVAQFGTTIAFTIALLKKFAEKKVLQRVAASRAVREGFKRIHDRISDVYVAAGLGNAPEMTAWSAHEDAAIDEQHARLTELVANPIALINNLSSSQIEEALTELRLEITRRPNPGRFRELMKTAIAVVMSQLGNNAPTITNIPIWYVSRDDVEIGEQIDVGGFGAVHRAKWNSTDVCVKLLFADGADGQEAFLREAGVWHRLSHPHVVPMLGGCHVGAPLFFISELATQGNLADYLDASSANHQQLWRLLYETAQGLMYVHRMGIVHTEIKCSNILVGNNNKAKLCDFGERDALMYSSLTTLKGRPVSVRWKSPECVLGYGREANPSFASDVYALGMSIIEAKTGNVPWNLVSDNQIIDEIASGNSYPRPDGVFTDAEWKLVQGMTALEVADRLALAQATEMMRELAQEEARLHQNGNDDVECSKCGNKCASGSNFCSECGFKLTKTLPVAHRKVTDEERERQRKDEEVHREYLRYAALVEAWSADEPKQRLEWEANVPKFSLCDACGIDNPLDNAFCCECGEEISMYRSRDEIEFRFVVTEFRALEGAIDAFKREADRMKRHFVSSTTQDALQNEIERLEVVLKDSRAAAQALARQKELEAQLPTFACPVCAYLNPDDEVLCRECGFDVEVHEFECL